MKLKKLLCGVLATTLVFAQATQITSMAIYRDLPVYATGGTEGEGGTGGETPADGTLDFSSVSVSIDGTAKVDETLEASVSGVEIYKMTTPENGTPTGVWETAASSDYTVTYSWTGGSGTPTDQATYKVVEDDVGSAITVTATIDSTKVGSKTSEIVVAKTQALTGSISITTDSNNVLTLDTKGITNTGITESDYTIKWTKDNSDISGATSTTYDTEGTAGKYKAVVTGTGDFTGSLTSSEIEIKDTTPTVTKPSAPTTLTLAPSSGQIKATWSAVTGADSYTVTCKQGSTTVKEEKGVTLTTTFTGLTNGTTYTVSVVAVNSAGSSSAKTATATPLTGATYTITFDYDGTDISDVTRTTNASGYISFPSSPDGDDYDFDGYKFKGWYTAKSGGTEVTSSTIFQSNQTVYAQWEEDDTTDNAETDLDTDDEVVNAEIDTDTDTDDGITTAKVSKDTFTSILADIQDAIDDEDDGEEIEEVNLTITANPSSSAETLRLEFGKSALKEFIEENEANDVEIETLIIETSFANIHLDIETIEELLSIQDDDYTDEELTFEITEVDTDDLSNDQEDEIDDRPVYKFVIFSGDDEDDTIDDFGGHDITLVFDYKLASNEEEDEIVVKYIDKDGDTEDLDTEVDEENDTVTATTDHFSVFFIDHENTTPVITPAVPTTWTSPFYDVTSTDWYYDEVQYVYENDLFDGTSTVQFSPDSKMTRAMVATVLWRLGGESYAYTVSGFNDVPSGTWYSTAVAWAVGQDIASGTGDNLFNPNGNITREELATMLYRYADNPSYFAGTFNPTDKADISSWAEVPMTWAISNGIITGYSDGSVKPQGTASRAEVATMLMRFDMRY